MSSTVTKAKGNERRRQQRTNWQRMYRSADDTMKDALSFTVDRDCKKSVSCLAFSVTICRRLNPYPSNYRISTHRLMIIKMNAFEQICAKMRELQQNATAQCSIGGWWWW